MCDVEASVLIELEKPAEEGDDQHLEDDDKEHNDPEELAGADVAENVNFIFDSSAADKIEDLQKNEGVEEESEVPTVVVVLIIPDFVVFLTTDEVELAICDCGFGCSMEVLCL